MTAALDKLNIASFTTHLLTVVANLMDAYKDDDLVLTPFDVKNFLKGYLTGCAARIPGLQFDDSPQSTDDDPNTQMVVIKFENSVITIKISQSTQVMPDYLGITRAIVSEVIIDSEEG